MSYPRGNPVIQPSNPSLPSAFEAWHLPSFPLPMGTGDFLQLSLGWGLPGLNSSQIRNVEISLPAPGEDAASLPSSWISLPTEEDGYFFPFFFFIETVTAPSPQFWEQSLSGKVAVAAAPSPYPDSTGSCCDVLQHLALSGVSLRGTRDLPSPKMSLSPGQNKQAGPLLLP